MRLCIICDEPLKFNQKKFCEKCGFGQDYKIYKPKIIIKGTSLIKIKEPKHPRVGNSRKKSKELQGESIRLKNSMGMGDLWEGL